jgi:hypothetical protein
VTLQQIEDRVMRRLGLTTSEQRQRVRDEINDRYREVQSTLNLGRTRRSTKTFTTVSGSRDVVASGVSVLETLRDTTVRKSPLSEITLLELRARDAADAVTGVPDTYAVSTHINDVLTLKLHPVPNQVIALSADVIASGTEMDSPDDEPTFSPDFHDILVHGALADEYMRVEKARPLGQIEEGKFEKRLGELRLHMARTAHLSRQTTDGGLLSGRRRVSPFYQVS